MESAYREGFLWATRSIVRSRWIHLNIRSGFVLGFPRASRAIHFGDLGSFGVATFPSSEGFELRAELL
jgi:hypothetical protein